MIAPLFVAALGMQAATPAREHELVPEVPAGWQSEQLELPPDFAPDLALEGVEELRFAPGMFERGSGTHWTYLFGLDVTAPGGGELEVDRAFLEDFLTRYYRGLCGAMGSSRGLVLDPGRVRAQVEGGGAAFTAAVELLDAFGDGAPLELALDVLVHPKAQGVELLALVAPAGAGESVRAELAALGQAWRAARALPVFLNHVILTPDLATYEALAASELLRELAVVEERTTRRGDTEYTSLYLYGEHTYVQFVKADPAASLFPGTSGVAFCIELAGGLERAAAALRAAGAETFTADITRELDGTPLPWFKLLGIQTATAEQRLQLFAMQYEPQFLQRWHASDPAGPERIDRRAVLERTRAVLGGAADAPFADVRGVELVLDPDEYPRYVQVVTGLGLAPEKLPGDSSGEDRRGERGSGFLLAAESAERAPGGIVVVDLELRRALEPQSVDFGQVELSIAGELARIHFEHGLPVARKLGLPALARGIVFTPDGQELIASSFDGLIHVFDVASGAETRQIVPPDDVAPLTILPLRGLLVAGGADFSGHCPLYVFDLASGAVLQELAGHRSAVQALCVSPDGTQLASAGSEGIIKVWDTSGWTCVRRIDCNVQDAESSAILRGVAFSPDGRQIAGFGGQKAGGADWNTPLVRIWDIASGELVSELAGGHSDSMLCGRFSAEGKTLYTASSDRTARAWDLATGAELRRIESSHPLYGVGFSPDGKTLVLCDGELRFFDTATFASDSALGDSAAQLDVSRFVFSPDGRMLATDGGGVLYLWDLSAR